LRKTRDLVAVFVLGILHLLLYRKVVRLWWTYDDVNNLRSVIQFPFHSPFVDGRVWPQQLFTPFMLLAAEAKLAMFGFDTSGWYVAHLVLAVAATLAVYAALRCFIEPVPALAGTAVYVAGVPYTAIVVQLSTVHYSIAVGFAACAVITYVVALRRSLRIVAAGSAVLYLAAMLAKEIAVPLPLVIIALPVRDLRTRMRYAAPHALALLLYFAWRHAVLGTFLGAYSWVIEPDEWPRLIGLLPWKVARASLGPNVILNLLLVALIVMAVAAAIRTRHALALLLVAAMVTLAPVLPVSKELHRRYALGPWLAVSIAFAIAIHLLGKRRLAMVLLCTVPALAIVVNRQQWGREFGLRMRMSDEARFYFEMPEGGLLRNPATAAPTMRELSWLKTEVLHQTAGGTAFYDDYFLCVNDATGKRVWQYEPEKRAVVEITSRIAGIAKRHCSSIRNDVPLSATFWYARSALRWDLGPYREGRYSALLANGLQAGEIQPRDGLYLPGATGVAVRVRYESPDGWTTYSPELALDFVRQPRMNWSRR
jgi:hypothetical protein